MHTWGAPTHPRKRTHLGACSIGQLKGQHGSPVDAADEVDLELDLLGAHAYMGARGRV